MYKVTLTNGMVFQRITAFDDCIEDNEYYIFLYDDGGYIMIKKNHIVLIEKKINE